MFWIWEVGVFSGSIVAATLITGVPLWVWITIAVPCLLIPIAGRFGFGRLKRWISRNRWYFGGARVSSTVRFQQCRPLIEKCLDLAEPITGHFFDVSVTGSDRQRMLTELTLGLNYLTESLRSLDISSPDAWALNSTDDDMIFGAHIWKPYLISLEVLARYGDLTRAQNLKADLDERNNV